MQEKESSRACGGFRERPRPRHCRGRGKSIKTGKQVAPRLSRGAGGLFSHGLARVQRGERPRTGRALRGGRLRFQYAHAVAEGEEFGEQYFPRGQRRLRKQSAVHRADARDAQPLLRVGQRLFFYGEPQLHHLCVLEGEVQRQVRAVDLPPRKGLARAARAAHAADAEQAEVLPRAAPGVQVPDVLFVDEQVRLHHAAALPPRAVDVRKVEAFAALGRVLQGVQLVRKVVRVPPAAAVHEDVPRKSEAPAVRLVLLRQLFQRRFAGLVVHLLVQGVQRVHRRAVLLFGEKVFGQAVGVGQAHAAAAPPLHGERHARHAQFFDVAVYAARAYAALPRQLRRADLAPPQQFE